MLDKKLIATFKETGKEFTGSTKRKFVAKITNRYVGGSARKAERIFGWNRKMVALGQKELSSKITCLPARVNPGRQRIEKKNKDLPFDISILLKNELQTDPKFRNDKQYCKMTSKEVCEQLSKNDKYKGVVFKERTMSSVLNRLGYTLKKH